MRAARCASIDSSDLFVESGNGAQPEIAKAVGCLASRLVEMNVDRKFQFVGEGANPLESLV